MCVFMSVGVDVNLSRGSKITGFKNALKSYHAVGNYKEIVLILVYVGFFFMLPFSCYVAKRPSQQRGRTSYNRLDTKNELDIIDEVIILNVINHNIIFILIKKNLCDFFTFIVKGCFNYSVCTNWITICSKMIQLILWYN